MHEVNAQGLEQTHPGQVQAQDMRLSSFSQIFIYDLFDLQMISHVEQRCIAWSIRRTERN